MASRPDNTEWCGVCVICGTLCIEVDLCRLHEDVCPERQVALTLKWMEAVHVAGELFGARRAEYVLATVERLAMQWPDSDPVDLVRRIKKLG